jgi:tetratricopeptide (TPR) repeat protein
MFFDYSKIGGVFSKVWAIVKDLLNIGSDSAENAYSSFVLGLKNRIGDQIIGSGYIHKGDQLSVLHQGVDPRDLEKYLNMLDAIEDPDDKEIQILDWYYAQDIDIALKESLLLIIAKLPEYVKYEMTFIPEKKEERESQLFDSLRTLSDIVSQHKFETLSTFADLELLKLKKDSHKVSFLVEVAKVYIAIRQYKKGLSYLEKAYDIDENFGILKHVVSLYKQLDDYSKVIDLLSPFKSIENVEDRVYVLSNLGSAYNTLGRLKESEIVLNTALEIHNQERHGDEYFADISIVSIYKNLVYAALKKGDVSSAQNVLFKATKEVVGTQVSSLEEILEIDQMQTCFLQIGVLLGIKNEWKLAEDFFKKRLDFINYNEGANQILREFVSVFTNLSVVALYQGDIQKMRNYISQLSEIVDQFGIETKSSKLYISLFKGLGYVYEDAISQGYIYLNRVFEAISSNSTNDKFLRAFTFAHLANVFSAKKDYEKAEFYLNKSKILTDELLGNNNYVSNTIQEKIDNLILSDFKILVIV